ncbi:MAG: hypothetical protein KBT69_12625 [Oceanihabitans sp.]|nr:hypothetical protein [Oceanihabitans sp.]
MWLPKVSLKSAFIIALIFVFSCTINKQVIAVEPEVVIPPKIIFLNYVLVKNARDEKSITLINQIKTEGKLKGKPESIENTNPGDLEYILLDKNFNAIEKHALKNPLKKTVEFVNDFGNFEKRIVDLDRVEFTLRIQLQPEAKHIVISEITNTTYIKHSTTKID